MFVRVEWGERCRQRGKGCRISGDTFGRFIVPTHGGGGVKTDAERGRGTCRRGGRAQGQ